jgi:hypothetical protein
VVEAAAAEELAVIDASIATTRVSAQFSNPLRIRLLR